MEESLTTKQIRPGSLAWIQTGLLLAVSSVFVFALSLTVGPLASSDVEMGQRIVEAFWATPGSLFPLFPFIVGISIGMCRPGPGLVQAASRIVLATTLLMFAVDLFAPPASLPSMISPVWIRGSVTTTGPRVFVFDGRAISGLIQLVSGAPSSLGETLKSYPPGHPRLLLTNSLYSLLLMAMPAAVVGFMLGIGTWIRGRVAFRHVKDELVARIALAWTLAPLSIWLVAQVSKDGQTRFLFYGGSAYKIFTPMIPFLVMGALGWWAARRSERDDRFGWDPLEEER